MSLKLQLLLFIKKQQNTRGCFLRVLKTVENKCQRKKSSPYLLFQRAPHLRFVQQSCSQMGNPWGHWKTAHIYKNKLKQSYCSQDEKTPIPCQQSLPMLNTYFGDSGVKGSDKLVDLAGNKQKKNTTQPWVFCCHVLHYPFIYIIYNSYNSLLNN